MNIKQTVAGIAILFSTYVNADNTVAKVIYSEASNICSSEEEYMVASVIKNRIGNPGFANGKLKTMKDVVLQKYAFSCVGDKSNSNWESFDKVNNRAKRLAVKLAIVDFTPYKDIVYYHDKTISKPKCWDNKYWTAVKVVETKHFIFYKIRKTK